MSDDATAHSAHNAEGAWELRVTAEVSKGRASWGR
jgi:hypothetical protein